MITMITIITMIMMIGIGLFEAHGGFVVHIRFRYYHNDNANDENSKGRRAEYHDKCDVLSIFVLNCCQYLLDSGTTKLAGDGNTR